MTTSTIALSEQCKEELKRLGRMGDSYQDVVMRLIAFYKMHEKVFGDLPDPFLLSEVRPREHA